MLDDNGVSVLLLLLLILSLPLLGRLYFCRSLSMGVCVCLCSVQNISKSCVDFGENFWRTGHGPGNSQLDFSGNLVPFPTLSQFFPFIMHFERGNNSLLLYARWQH